MCEERKGAEVVRAGGESGAGLLVYSPEGYGLNNETLA